jgi:hypothetical protein
VFLLSFFLGGGGGQFCVIAKMATIHKKKDLTKDRLHAKYENIYFENFAISLANLVEP